jgi:hypothetical protein
MWDYVMAPSRSCTKGSSKDCVNGDVSQSGCACPWQKNKGGWQSLVCGAGGPEVKECGAQCFDGRDNDGDGKIDCSDPDCINNDSTCEHDPHRQTTRTSIPLHAAAVHHDSLPEAEML